MTSVYDGALLIVINLLMIRILSGLLPEDRRYEYTRHNEYLEYYLPLPNNVNH